MSPFKFALLLTSEGTTDPLRLPLAEPGDEAALERTPLADRGSVGCLLHIALLQYPAGSTARDWPDSMMRRSGSPPAGR